MTARYAIYFSPADSSALARFGDTVLRRNARQAKRPRATDIASFHDPARWSALTETPARYGFHSTIKAPFELSADCTAAELLSATESLCTQFAPVFLSGLQVQHTPASAFLALREPQPEALSQLAAAVVKDLEDFRAPLLPADIARRQPHMLSVQQRQYLHEYGYPHVLNDFRFHMTLSGAIGAGDEDFVTWLADTFAQIVPCASSALDRLAVFRQTSRDTAFVRIAEFPFAAQPQQAYAQQA